MYEDTGPLAAPAPRQTLTGVDFCGSPFVCRLELQRQRHVGQVAPARMTLRARPAGCSLRDPIVAAATVRCCGHRTPELSFTPRSSALGEGFFTLGQISAIFHRRLIGSKSRGFALSKPVVSAVLCPYRHPVIRIPIAAQLLHTAPVSSVSRPTPPMSMTHATCAAHSYHKHL